MYLVDSHCHLDFPEFQEDLLDVLDRATHAGVGTFLSIATQRHNWPQLINLAESHDAIYASVGVHPTDIADCVLSELEDDLLKSAMHPKIVALGETGFDFYHTPHDKEHQETAFRAHVQASRITSLPLIIHTREADQATSKFLQACSIEGPLTGVMHCFTGDKEFAQRMLDLGFYISLSGIVTFKNAQTVHELARYVPLDRLLVETDAPFLAPSPFRGKRNEPSFVLHTAQKIAELRGIPLSEVAHRTTDNFFRLFTKTKKA